MLILIIGITYDDSKTVKSRKCMMNNTLSEYFPDIKKKIKDTRKNNA